MRGENKERKDGDTDSADVTSKVTKLSRERQDVTAVRERFYKCLHSEESAVVTLPEYIWKR